MNMLAERNNDMRGIFLFFCLWIAFPVSVYAEVPHLNSQGFLIVQNEVLFPVILYRVPIGQFTEMKEAGFTGTEVSEYAADQKELQKYLDAAAEKKFKILPIFNYAATRMLPELYQKMVERFRCREEILLWYLADEPQEYRITPEGARSMYRAIKKADPIRPVLLMLAKVDPAYMTAADIIAVDPYPIAKDKPLTYVAEMIQEAKRFGQGRPVWACLEAFGALSYGRPFPKPAELRCMTYMALAQGIQGIMFFAYGCPEQKGLLAETSPELWHELLRLASEIRERSGIFSAQWPVQTQQLTPDIAGVYSRLFERNGQQWLLLVNGTRTGVKTEVKIPGLKRVQQEVSKGTQLFPVRRESFQVELAPLEVRWYNILKP